MTCEETQHALDAYVDGELDWSMRRSIESHLGGCRDCARFLSNLKSLVSALRNGGLRYKAPQHLNAMVRTGEHREHPNVRRSFAHWQWTGAAAAVLLIIALTGVVPSRTRESSLETQLTGEIISSHVRSMMASHLTDIPSSDTHNVKPWFADKLDYSPPTKDLSAQGFPLIGGRMEYLENRPVAALVYRRNQHVINLFVWPADESRTKPDTRSAVRGYNLIHWTQGGMTWWLISDLEPAQLSECAALLRD
jgi:anti-sigma factor RsiW